MSVPSDAEQGLLQVAVGLTAGSDAISRLIRPLTMIATCSEMANRQRRYSAR